MTDYSYDDFDFEKPLEEWTEEEKRAVVNAAKDIIDREDQSSDSAAESPEAVSS